MLFLDEAWPCCNLAKTARFDNSRLNVGLGLCHCIRLLWWDKNTSFWHNGLLLLLISTFVSFTWRWRLQLFLFWLCTVATIWGRDTFCITFHRVGGLNYRLLLKGQLWIGLGWLSLVIFAIGRRCDWISLILLVLRKHVTHLTAFKRSKTLLLGQVVCFSHQRLFIC